LAALRTNSAGQILWQGQELLGDYTQQLVGDCPAGVMALVHQSFNQPMEIRNTPPPAGGMTSHMSMRRSRRHSKCKASVGRAMNSTCKAGSYCRRPHHAEPRCRLSRSYMAAGISFSAGFPRRRQARLLLDNGYALLLPNPRGKLWPRGELCMANVRDFWLWRSTRHPCWPLMRL